MTSDDLYVYNANDSSITLSPSQDKKLTPCEVAGQILLIFKGKRRWKWLEELYFFYSNMLNINKLDFAL